MFCFGTVMLSILSHMSKRKDVSTLVCVCVDLKGRQLIYTSWCNFFSVSLSP